MKGRLVERLLETKSLKFGDFILSSGKRSNVYVDIKHASTFPDVLRMMAESLVECVKDVEFEKLACIELGGVPLAVAVSMLLNKPYLILRKEKKTYGVGEDMIGDVEKGDRVVVVEDVITTGSSVMSVVKRLEKRGCNVVAVAAVVDRGEWRESYPELNPRSVLKLSDLLDYREGV